MEQVVVSRCSYVIDEKSNKQCSRNGVISVESGKHYFCWQHHSLYYKDKYSVKVVPEPWELVKLSVSPDVTKLSNETIKNIRKMLRTFPGVVEDKDAEGLIYCFQLQEGCDDPMYYKVGFVKSQDRLKDRLEEWRDCKLIDKWPIKYPSYAESLVHLILGHWRCQRYVLYAAKAPPGRQKRYVSTWYGTDDLVPDCFINAETCPAWMPDNIWESSNATTDISLRTKASERYRMEDEWFYCDYDYISRIIKAVLELLSSDRASTAEKWFLQFC